MTLGKPLGSKRRSLKYRLLVGVASAVVIAVWLLFEVWFIWNICRIASSIFHDLTPLALNLFTLLLVLVIVSIALIVRARAKRTSRR